MNRLFAFFALSLALSGSTLFASIITYNSIIPDNMVSFNDTVLLQGFNSSLGSLIAIEVTLSATGNVNIAIEDKSATSYSYTNASASTALSVTGPQGNVLFAAFNETAASAYGTVSAGINIPQSVSFTTTRFANPTDLADYVTSGNVSLQFVSSELSASGTTSAPGNTVYFGGGADAGGTVSVTYTFTPPGSNALTPAIPEPATASLFASGCAGLFFLARKRAKKA